MMIRRYTDRQRFVIVTQAGGGTTYMQQLLEANGLDVGQENMEHADGGVGFNLYDLKYRVHYDKDSILFSPFLHQVRHPLGAISSLTTMGGGPNFEYVKLRQIATGAPLHWNLRDSRLLSRMRYWLQWHVYLNGVCQDTFTVESIGDPDDIDALDRLSGWIGYPLDPDLRMKIPPALSSRMDAPNRIHCTWAMLAEEDLALHDDICFLAEKFGYATEDIDTAY